MNHLAVAKTISSLLLDEIPLAAACSIAGVHQTKFSLWVRREQRIRAIYEAAKEKRSEERRKKKAEEKQRAARYAPPGSFSRAIPLIVENEAPRTPILCARCRHVWTPKRAVVRACPSCKTRFFNDFTRFKIARAKPIKKTRVRKSPSIKKTEVPENGVHP